MSQSETLRPPVRARAIAKAIPAGASTIRQALAAIVATGVIAVVIGLLPHF